MTEQQNTPELRFSEFKDEWKLAKFKDIFIFHNNLRKPIKESLRVSGQYPYYGATGIIDYVDDFIFDGNYILIGEDGANIISRSAPLVYLAKGKFWVNNHAHILTPSSGDIHYLYQVAELVNYEKYNTGTAQPKLNIQNLKNISVNISMNLAEQEKIGEFFSKLDQQIELEEKKLELLEQQKKGYMQKIFSQELRFKDENRNEYPNWKKRKIQDLMEVTSVKRIHQSDWQTSGVPFLRARDIVAYNKGDKIEEPLFISNYKYNAYSKISGKVEKGDLLVTGVGTIGVPFLIKDNKPLYFKDGNIIWLKNQKKLNENFLFYSFLSTSIQNYIKRVAGVGTVGTFTIKNAKKTPIFEPIKEEQEKIGNFFSKLDELINKQNQKIDGLKKRKRGFLQKMFV